MDLKEIRTLIDLMKENGIAVFKMEKEGFGITLKTSAADAPPAPAVVAAPVLASPPPAPVAVMAEIKSPMVGTFYASASPESAPFVSAGQEVTPETVVCIVEAMKVMNEIKAEATGVVAEICVENGKPVQFGQALFRLK